MVKQRLKATQRMSRGFWFYETTVPNDSFHFLNVLFHELRGLISSARNFVIIAHRVEPLLPPFCSIAC